VLHTTRQIADILKCEVTTIQKERAAAEHSSTAAVLEAKCEMQQLHHHILQLRQAVAGSSEKVDLMYIHM